MKKVWCCIASAALLIAVALAAVSASSASPSQELSLLDITGQQHGLNGFHFQRAPRAGDQIAQTDSLYKLTAGKPGPRVGRVESIITTKTGMSQSGAVGLLIAQAFLPSGSLFIEGYARFGGPDPAVSFPVPGGTGAYASAHGYVLSRHLSENKTTLDFHLMH